MASVHIGIGGNIGSGKTTLVRWLGDNLNDDEVARQERRVHVFLENVAENPFFDRFYADKPRWAYHSQMAFLKARIRTHELIRAWPGIAIEDRTAYEDCFVFAHSLHEQELISHDESDNYRFWFRESRGKLLQPSMFVYLKVPEVSVLLERIKKRGRESEKKITPEYLENLNQRYEVIANMFGSRTITVDATQDLDQNPDYTNSIVERIRKLLHPRFGEHKLIAVAGNIGLGKSSITDLLREHGAEGLYENPDENPVLKEFYNDMSGHALPLQKEFLRMRSQQLEEARKYAGTSVVDRSIYEDLLIFVPALRKLGHLKSEGAKEFETEFRSKIAQLPQPDLLICLTGTPELAWDCVRKRSKDYELDAKNAITLEYLKLLQTYYDKFEENVRQFYKGPILRVNRNETDFVNVQQDKARVLVEVAQSIK